MRLWRHPHTLYHSEDRFKTGVMRRSSGGDFFSRAQDLVPMPLGEPPGLSAPPGSLPPHFINPNPYVKPMGTYCKHVPCVHAYVLNFVACFYFYFVFPSIIFSYLIRSSECQHHFVSIITPLPCLYNTEFFMSWKSGICNITVLYILFFFSLFLFLFLSNQQLLIVFITIKN